jgi:hypothetical protein
MLLKRIFLRCLSLVVALQFSILVFQTTPTALAATSIVPSAGAMSKIVTTEHQNLSATRCQQIKKAFPSHAKDKNICVVTITHTIIGPTSLVSRLDSKTMRLRPNMANYSCTSGGSYASAYDDLSYSYMWTEELYTRFHYYSAGCTPTLVANNGYPTYAIVGLTELTQSTGSYTEGTLVTAFENITSKNGVFGYGAEFSSCQSRGLDGYGAWPYRSNLYAQDC